MATLSQFLCIHGTLKFSMIGLDREDDSYWEMWGNHITAWNLVAWCNVPWSESLFEMATLNQCSHFPLFRNNFFPNDLHIAQHILLLFTLCFWNYYWDELGLHVLLLLLPLSKFNYLSFSLSLSSRSWCFEAVLLVFYDCTIEIWEWMSNFISHCTRCEIINPCWDPPGHHETCYWLSKVGNFLSWIYMQSLI